MTNDFDHLMQRFLDRTATEEERFELFKLILSGRYDDRLADAFFARIEEERQQQHAQEDADAMKELYASIVEQYKQSPGVIPMQAHGNRGWWMTAAAAVIALAIVALLWFTRRGGEQETLMAAEESAVFSGKQYIRLPDNSTVVLNEGSELTYTPSFGKETRDVFLKGEGYFDIQHDPSRPFLVHAGSVTTRVLGTAFNVKEDNQQREVVVTVERGLVEVGYRSAYAQVEPDQQIRVDTKTRKFTTKKVSAETALTWKSEYLILDRVTMEEAARLIAEKYDVTVTIKNPNLKSCQITAWFEGETLEHVLKIVTSLTQANYTMKDGAVSIDGGSCQ